MSQQDDPKTLLLSTKHKYAYKYKSASPGLPTFLLLHGFPSTSVIWDRVVKHLLRLGFGILRPDLLGSGETSKPTDLQDYSLQRMSSEMVEILAHHQLKSVFGVGHGLGAYLLTRMWWYYPQYLAGLAFMGAGYILPTPIQMELMANRAPQMKGNPSHTGGYWDLLPSEEAAQLLNSNIASFISIMYSQDPDLHNAHLLPRGELQKWISAGRYSPWPLFDGRSDADMRMKNSLISAFTRGGFDAPLNWYKAIRQQIDRDHELALTKNRCVINRPVQFLVGERDALGRPDLIRAFVEEGRRSGYLPNSMGLLLKNSSHWMMIEKPDQVSEALLELVDRALSNKGMYQPMQHQV